MELGTIIAQLRKQKGLNQREFANILGVSNGAVAMWETNKRQPDLEMIKKIATYNNVSVDYLLGIEPTDYEWKLPYIENRFTLIIRELENQMKISLQDITKDLQISLETLNEFMQGISIPSLDFLKKMSSQYKIDLDYLMGASYYTHVPISLDGIPANGALFDYTFRSRFEALCFTQNISSLNCDATLGLSERDFFDISYNRMPTLFELLVISYYFNVTLDYLIGKSDIPSTSDAIMNTEEKRLLKAYQTLSSDDKTILMGKALELRKNSTSVAADEPLKKAK